MNESAEHTNPSPGDKHETLREEGESPELRRAYGRFIYRSVSSKSKSDSKSASIKRLSQSDRRLIAQNIGKQLRRRNIKRRELAATKHCRDAGIDHQELYRLVLTPEEDNVRSDRLRADLRKYLAIISAIAQLKNIDRDLLAHQIISGASIHPSKNFDDQHRADIINHLYEVAELVDRKFKLTSRFLALSERINLLPATDPFAFWPYGADYTQSDQKAASSKLPHNYWGLSEGESWTYSELMLENTSLLQVIRYLPHILIGIREDFDDCWRIKETAESSPPEKVSIKHLFLGPTITEHPDALVLRKQNRQRLTEYFGDSFAPRLEWNRQNGELMIGGILEQDYIEKGKQHMMAYHKEVDVNPDWSVDQNELFFEHTLWLCLYPTWHPINADEPSLIPVILENYASGGANGELTMEDVESYLQSRSLTERFLGGATLLERLEEMIGSSGGEPEILTELSRTAEFIEEHPLLKRYRKMEEGADYIRKMREKLDDEI